MDKYDLNWGQWRLDLESGPKIMGVVNVTPDSFSDGGDFYSTGKAVEQGLQLVEAGADIIDVGGESTRPGSKGISEQEEINRVIPVIKALAAQTDELICVDTTKAGVACVALDAGAAMVNDISAGNSEPELLRIAAGYGVPVVLMHMKGMPRSMQENPTYDDLMGEIKSYLCLAAERAEEAGVRKNLIIIDPGIGFGKTFDHNLTLINRLDEFQSLNRPILLGASRKAFLGQILGGVPPKERETATEAINALAVYKGANIIRTHKVESTKQMLAVAHAVRQEKV